MVRFENRCKKEKDTTMMSQQLLLSRRTFLTAMSLGVVGSAVSLRGANALVPETNARTKPSSLNIVLYTDKMDIDQRLFPLQQKLAYSFAITSECMMFHAFHIANAKGERLITIPNIGPGQTVTMDWMFDEAGDYTLINERFSGYLYPGGLMETTVTVAQSSGSEAVC